MKPKLPGTRDRETDLSQEKQVEEGPIISVALREETRGLGRPDAVKDIPAGP